MMMFVVIIAGSILPTVGGGGCRILNMKVGLNVGKQSLDADWEHFYLIQMRREGLTEEAVLIIITITIGVGGEEPMMVGEADRGGEDVLLLKCWCSSGCGQLWHPTSREER